MAKKSATKTSVTRKSTTGKPVRSPRREESLSRDRIVEASIALLDDGGEDGLTFRALSERLATGAGAIYWHVPNKSELLTAACDAVVSRTMNAVAAAAAPEATLQDVALALFDAIDAHPWVGSALMRSPGQLPMVRIIERIGQQVRSLGVREDAQWAAVGTLLNYILGVGGQNAANGQLARAQQIDRLDFLGSVATAWSELDAGDYPFTRSLADKLRSHDDREDFLAGLDLILSGIKSELPE